MTFEQKDESGDESAAEPTSQDQAPTPPRKRKKRSRLRKMRNRLGRALATRFGAAAVRRLIASCEKIEVGREHREKAESDHEGLLVAIWHGRGVLAAPFYEVEDATILVSASEDGSMATRILDELEYEIIRGSTSKQGVRALREMKKTIAKGKHVGITPDGPRGPLHSMSPGLAFLARATGVPVLPIGFGVEKAWHLDTWDHYTIPKPGTRVVACYKPAIYVARDASNDDLHAASEKIGRSLVEAEREAFAHLGVEPDWEVIAREASKAS